MSNCRVGCKWADIVYQFVPCSSDLTSKCASYDSSSIVVATQHWKNIVNVKKKLNDMCACHTIMCLSHCIKVEKLDIHILTFKHSQSLNSMCQKGKTSSTDHMN